MIKFYNTLSRKKEIFRPRRGKKVNLFVCGPTVYDFSHLGHARTYIIFDAISNYLREMGYEVFYLQNITDIDDKIIKRAKEEGETPRRIARFFEKEYFKDTKSLKIDGVTKYARATDHIKEIQSQVRRLLKKGYAYEIKDGIYYDISRFKDYGKLSRRTVLQAEDAVSRIDEAKEKKNKGDFCLWKRAKPGEPKWKSPWNWGRPGWHIEDTAITEKYFSPQYDIHGGGRDLIFPHHEAEIAQMEAISGKSPMAKYWLHTGFLTISGQKMAKSLGNFITIREFLKRNSPETLRLFVLSSHYRSPIDYNKEVILQAKRNLNRLNEFFDKIKSKMMILPKNVPKVTGRVRKYLQPLEDDFNTPKFFSKLFNFVRKTNKKIDKLSKREMKEIYQFLIFTNKVFKTFPEKREKVPRKILKLVREREEYRKLKDWKKADKIRKKIKKLGWWVEDTEKGTKIKKLKV